MTGGSLAGSIQPPIQWSIREAKLSVCNYNCNYNCKCNYSDAAQHKSGSRISSTGTNRLVQEQKVSQNIKWTWAPLSVDLLQRGSGVAHREPGVGGWGVFPFLPEGKHDKNLRQEWVCADNCYNAASAVLLWKTLTCECVWGPTLRLN